MWAGRALLVAVDAHASRIAAPELAFRLCRGQEGCICSFGCSASQQFRVCFASPSAVCDCSARQVGRPTHAVFDQVQVMSCVLAG
eukprot:6554891-Alexandrium_andersonii.AAC.1